MTIPQSCALLRALKRTAQSTSEIIYIDRSVSGKLVASIPVEDEKPARSFDLSPWSSDIDAILTHLEEEDLLNVTCSAPGDTYDVSVTYKGWHFKFFCLKAAFNSALKSIIFPIVVAFVTALITALIVTG